MIAQLLQRRNDIRVLLMADQALMSANGFASNFLLAWSLGLHLYGSYALAILALSLVNTVIQSVLLMPAQVRYPRLSASRQPAYLGAIFLAALLSIGVLSVLNALVFHLLYDYAIGVIPMALGGAAWLMSDFLRRLAILARPGKALLAADSFSTLVLLLGLVVLKPSTADAAFALLGTASLCSLILLAILPFQIPQAKDWRHMLLYTLQSGKWLLPTALVQWGSSNFLIMAAAWWVSGAVLGTLRLAQYVFGLLNIFLQAYEGFALPRIASWPLHQRSRLIPVLQLSWPFLGPVLVLSIGIGLLFPVLVPALHLSEAPVPIWIPLGMTVLYVCIVLVYPLRMLIRAAEMNRSYFFAHVVSLGFIVLLSPFIIGRLGASGIVAGMILSQLILGLLWLRQLNNQHPHLWKLSTSH
jgi:O-antigen/teichoic acid export membrane protein